MKGDKLRKRERKDQKPFFEQPVYLKLSGLYSPPTSTTISHSPKYLKDVVK